MNDPFYAAGALIGGRYTVQKLIGAGSFSHVYQVVDALSGRVYALKIFKDMTNILQQTRNEFNMLTQLHHPNIAQVYGMNQITERRAYCLELEFIEGDELANLIKSDQISLAKGRQIAANLLDAVVYLHEQHIIHRDISPKNIVVGERGAVIVDFNISRQIEAYASTIAGTLRYMPPEVATSGWTLQGDLYSLGITFYEMLTSHYPFDGGIPGNDSMPRDPREYKLSLSASLTAALLRSIAPDSAQRFQTAAEMQTAFLHADWELAPSATLRFARTDFAAADATRPNVNPVLWQLLRLYSQSQQSNAGTRGLDDFARATYVPTRMDKTLKATILTGQYSLVIITGNAGDGKTAFIQNVENDIENGAFPAASWRFARLASGNGATFTLNDHTYLTNYDGSQDEGEVTNDDVLLHFFDPFQGNHTLPIPHLTHVIAINEGRLIEFLQHHRDTFDHLYRQVRDFFEKGQQPDPRILIINLNLRAMVADSDGQPDATIFDEMLVKLTNPQFFTACQNCDIADRCYVKFNADTFNDPTYGRMVRERLRVLFQISHVRRKLHITMRDLRSALAYILFGTRDCDNIHHLLATSGDGTEYQANYYYNAPFATDDTASQDRLVQLLAQVDPAQMANPRLDSLLAFSDPGAISVLPPFDARSRADVAGLQHLHTQSQGAADGTDIIAATQRLHAALRRKAYFEQIGEHNWQRMLPYPTFAKFIKLVQSPTSETLAAVRNTIVTAISMSEGIYHPTMGRDFLCLRMSQDARASIKSFRRFRKTDFVCRVPGDGTNQPFIEYLAPYLVFEYLPNSRAQVSMEVSLDLHELLYRMKQGYTPSRSELRGTYINLLIFKRQLASAPYEEILLTEDEQSFYHVYQTSNHALVIKQGEL